MTCQNCGKREATKTWLGEGGSLALLHGLAQEWCELCVVQYQHDYATKAAAGLPRLRERLDELTAAAAKESGQ